MPHCQYTWIAEHRLVVKGFILLMPVMSSLALCRGLLQLANSNFVDAYEHFKKLTELDSSNVVVSLASLM